MSESIKIRGYKSFASSEGAQWFDEIKKINIVIWKNNSWKSCILELIEIFLQCLKNWMPFNLWGQLNEFNGTIEYHTGWDKAYLLRNQSTANAAYRNNISDEFWDGWEFYTVYRNASILTTKELRKVHAERDIIPEVADWNDWVTQLWWDWKFATQLLRQLFNESSVGVINTRKAAEELKRDFLLWLQAIIEPDIKFIDITTIQKKWTTIWEIYFKNENNDFIPLSKMWSGMKTILLVLINLIIKPRLDWKDISNYIFILEELENNLHPAIQRRLYKFISDYSNENDGVLFFISTHSNVVIDIFSKNKDSQILHVSQENWISKVKTLLNKLDEKQVLEELDFRASDLLQTNWIIWVEWPSDRVYINKWLQLKFPELKEWIHYSIMFYWWKLLSHLSFRDSEEYEVTNFIELLKINKNAFVVIDRDWKRATDKIRTTKVRINNELGSDNCWITDWIEIENYLNWWILTRWLNWKYSYMWSSVNIWKFDKIDWVIPASIWIKYSNLKVKYSQEIIEYVLPEDINFDRNLSDSIILLWWKIKKWNNLS